MATTLVTNALQRAIGHSQPQPWLVHHSDHGSQYVSSEYQGPLRDTQMICNMSRKGNCYDNAVVERVFRGLKDKGFSAHPPETRAQATLGVIDYLAIFYNRQRLHSTVGYRSPNAFESQAVQLN